MFFRTLKLELHIHRTRLIFLIVGAAFLSLISCLSFFNVLYLQSLPESRILPSFWDQLAHAYEGTPPFVADREVPFQIPIVYFIQHLLLLLTLGGTTECYFEPYGYEIFTRIPKRGLWWYAHSAFCLIASVLYCLTAVTVTAIFCLASGADFSLSSYSGLSLPGVISWPGPGSIQIFTLFLTPLFVWSALGMLLQAIELLFGSLPAFLALVCLIVAGAFLDTPLLFANHTILLRSCSFLGSGTTLFQTFGICLGVIALSLVTGLVVLSHKDMLV